MAFTFNSRGGWWELRSLRQVRPRCSGVILNERDKDDRRGLSFVVSHEALGLPGISGSRAHGSYNRGETNSGLPSSATQHQVLMANSCISRVCTGGQSAPRPEMSTTQTKRNVYATSYRTLADLRRLSGPFTLRVDSKMCAGPSWLPSWVIITATKAAQENEFWYGEWSREC